MEIFTSQGSSREIRVQRQNLSFVFFIRIKYIIMILSFDKDNPSRLDINFLLSIFLTIGHGVVMRPDASKGLSVS